MMGTKIRHFSPLPNLSLEELVPKDNFYRRLEERLDLSFVRELVRDCYACSGRPSVDPVVFFRLQLVMFFENIRSERRLMEVAADRLSIRWFVGYDLHEPLPDHSSLTRIRERYGLETFRRFFERIVEECFEAGLVRGDELFFDSTKVRADADIDSLCSRSIAENHLDGLFEEEIQEPEAESSAAPRTPPTTALPAAEDSKLAEENGQRGDWIGRAGRQDRAFSSGPRKRTADLRVSRTDPDATPMRVGEDETKLGYQAHYVVDGGKARIIVGALVTSSEVTENRPMLDLLWRTTFRWGLKPHHVTGDGKYGTAENIAAVEDAGIRAYVGLHEAGGRGSGFFPKSVFSYDAERDVYLCPAGELLRPLGDADKRRRLGEVVTYRAVGSVCAACPLKPECTTNKNGRNIRRGPGDEYIDRVRAYHGTFSYEKALRKRKVWVEPLFAEAKDWHGMRRFRLRGLEKVNIEALLIASGQNVKRLLAFGGRRPKKLAQAAALRLPEAPPFYSGCYARRYHRGVLRRRRRRFSTRWNVFDTDVTERRGRDCMKTLDNLKLKAFRAPKRGKTGRFLPRCTTKTTPQTLLERLFIQSLDGVMRSSFPARAERLLSRSGWRARHGLSSCPAKGRTGRSGAVLLDRRRRFTRMARSWRLPVGAWMEGRTMGFEQAVAYALKDGRDTG